MTNDESSHYSRKQQAAKSRDRVAACDDCGCAGYHSQVRRPDEEVNREVGRLVDSGMDWESALASVSYRACRFIDPETAGTRAFAAAVGMVIK